MCPRTLRAIAQQLERDARLIAKTMATDPCEPHVVRALNSRAQGLRRQANLAEKAQGA